MQLAVGGAGLAAGLPPPSGLVDEYRPFVYPVILGAGKPFFPGAGGSRSGFDACPTHGCSGLGVVYLRYEIA